MNSEQAEKAVRHVFNSGRLSVRCPRHLLGYAGLLVIHQVRNSGDVAYLSIKASLTSNPGPGPIEEVDIVRRKKLLQGPSSCKPFALAKLRVGLAGVV